MFSKKKKKRKRREKYDRFLFRYDDFVRYLASIIPIYDFAFDSRRFVFRRALISAEKDFFFISILRSHPISVDRSRQSASHVDTVWKTLDRELDLSRWCTLALCCYENFFFLFFLHPFVCRSQGIRQVSLSSSSDC